MSARDAERGSGHTHPRPVDLAIVNGIAQCDVAVATRADIAHGRESGMQGFACIQHAVQCLTRYGDLQCRVTMKTMVAREVIVHIYQSGQHGFLRQVDDRCSHRNLDILRWTDSRDPVTADDDDLVLAQAAIDYIDQAPRLDIACPLVCSCIWRCQQQNRQDNQ